MRYSFIILLNDIGKLKNKLNAIKILKDAEIIIVGPEKYKNLFDNYIVDDLSNKGRAYNKGISKANGRYVNFSLASSYLKRKSLKKMDNYINGHILKRIYRFDWYSEDNQKSPIKNDRDIENITITDYPGNFSLVIDGYFFPKHLLGNFKEELGNFSSADFVIRKMCLIERCVKFNNDYVYISDKNHNTYKSDDAYNKDWYTKFVKEYILDLLKSRDCYYVKYIAYYLILMRFVANANTNNKGVLNKEELDEFINTVKECLEYIPAEIVFNFSDSHITSNYNNTMILLKDSKFYENYSREFLYTKALDTIVNVCAINNNKNTISIDLEFDGLEYIEQGFKIIVKLDNKILKINRNYIYSESDFFDIRFKEKFTFNIEIDKKELKNNSILKFYLKKDDEDEEMIYVGFNNNRPQARLINQFNNTYWKYEKNRVITSDRKVIYFKKMNVFRRILRELKLYKDFVFESRKRKLGVQALFLRILYRLSRFLYKGKHIWITFDKLYKGGDNGEYFYQYCKKRKGKYKCYYIINKEAYDYKRLKYDRRVVPFKSIRSYLAILNSECVFATHAGCSNFMAFTGGKEKYFRDLFNYDVFCLQHGLTIQDIPHMQNRLKDNTKLYFCASPNEIKNLIQPSYDYKEEMLLKTGIPRFDGLKNNDQRQILLTPTWRNNMANHETVIGGTRPYFSEFKNTEYFKVFNSLINNKKLIEAAKKYNYRIIYLIHPTLTSQINDFDKNDYVDIFTVTQDQSYEKLLTESSLMITDYSGVQYDFAYMRKPILYFHPDELPPHYGSTGLDYEKEGFGPIIKTSKELIDELINKMSKDCVNEKKYIERADKFFYYNDFNSCKRIYNAVIKYLNSK